MSFTESIKICFRKYVDFNGRASRPEYWWFFLFNFIVQLATSWIPVLGTLIAVGLLLPSLAVTARRLHDTNRTGWWMLLPIIIGFAGIITGVIIGGVIEEDTALWVFFLTAVIGGVLGLLVGFLVLLVFLVQPSDPGQNRYGPNPVEPQQDMGGYAYAPTIPYAPPPDPPGTGEPGTGEPGTGNRLYCTQCGAERLAEARFCNICGTEV